MVATVDRWAATLSNNPRTSSRPKAIRNSPVRYGTLADPLAPGRHDHGFHPASHPRTLPVQRFRSRTTVPRTPSSRFGTDGPVPSAVVSGRYASAASRFTLRSRVA